jgi:hypothetical protein
METNTLSAGSNPALANDLINQAIAVAEGEEETKVAIKNPDDPRVELPGGYVLLDGSVVRDAEVRELTGKDEEIIAKSASVGRTLNTVLSRGVVSIGGIPASEDTLDQLLAGDRDELLLAIHRVTFGSPAEVSCWCATCEEYKTVGVDLDTEIPRRKLADPANDRQFTVKGKKAEYKVNLPDGRTQKALNTAADKTFAEMTTILLEHTVAEINGGPVYSPQQVQNMPLVDRRKVIEALSEKGVGPKFDDLEATCPDCEAQVVVPVNLGALFRFF